MTRRTLFALTLGSVLTALTKPAQALSEHNGEYWLPLTVNTEDGPRRVQVRAKALRAYEGESEALPVNISQGPSQTPR